MRTLTVTARDKAGNQSAATTYTFNVGRAGLSLPAPGANVVKRTKLAIDGDATYTRVTFQYRRGPGAVVQDVPLANLTTAAGAPVTASPASLTGLGGYAVWTALDTLGSPGGVVQVRARLYSADPQDAGYPTQWITVNVDPDGGGAATTDIGPGSLNALTGEFTLSATDADVFGLTAMRTSASRAPASGWLPQGERLTTNQQQVFTDTTGFGPSTATVTRVTTRGQGGTAESLQLVPPAGGDADTYAAVGGDIGGLRCGMQGGHRYRVSGWIYVPASTGLTTDNPARGERIVVFTRVGSAGYVSTASPAASFTDGWQQLTVDVMVPAGATEAFVRLYDGFTGGRTDRVVYWDNLSVRELLAPFGPQWRGGTTDPASGLDYAGLDFPSADLAAVTLASGEQLTFGRSTTGQFFPQPGAETLSLAALDATRYQLSALDGTIVEFTRQVGSTRFLPTATWNTGAPASSTTRYAYDLTDNRSLVTRVIAPTEPGVGDCAAATPAIGCRVLQYDYAAATTATATTFGDVAGQVRALELWTWNPASGAEQAALVARYAYDDQGRLRESWDPRVPTPLKTAYSYDAAGHVISTTPPGQLPWTFDYGTVGTDANPGRLLRVHRASLVQGSATQPGPDTVTRIVYGVPTTRAAGGPYDMAATTAATWGQDDPPVDATAVFGPPDDPKTTAATATTPGRDGYTYATVHYLNASGQEADTATPAAAGVGGGNIDVRQYDRFGHVAWSLEATNRLLALGTLPGAAATLADLGLAGMDTRSRANQLATADAYAPDGTDLVATTGPTVRTVLASAFDGHPAGAVVNGRVHTVRVYDEGKPDGAAYHLLTTETSGVTVAGASPGAGDADTRVTVTGYDPINGSASGWTLRRPTVVTVDAAPGGAAVASHTVYDAGGRIVRAWGAGATGTDAATRVTVFYSAGTNAADTACGNHPEWAGLACATAAGAAVTGHEPASMPGTLPVRRITYARFGGEATVVETNAGRTRTTTTGYDPAGRVATVSVTSDDAAVAVPAVTTSYDPATGLVSQVSANGVSLVTAYDMLGRVISYTDADGATTSSQYDQYDHLARTVDPTGTVTYAYDRVAEPRDLVTSVTDSTAGTLAAGYSPDGKLTTVHYPGGVTRTDTLDANLKAVGRVFTRDADGTTIFAETRTDNAFGQVARDVYTGGSRTLGYDRRGRLVTATQTDAAGQCVTRGYEFAGAAGDRGDRTALRTWQPAAGGACSQASTPTTVSYAYDTADRLVGGYTYDEFGRTRVLPGGLAMTYYANDMVASQALGADHESFTLDPATRIRTQVHGGTTTVNHYNGTGDDPTWSLDGGAWTRDVAGPDGDLAMTVTQTGRQLLTGTNLHGDVVFTWDEADPYGYAFYDYDEFGNRTAGDAGRYGWLGGKQRSADALGGVILMGVRLYHAPLGRFLSVDPVPGGSCNAYDYACADPADKFDLDGRCLPSIFGAGCRYMHAVNDALHGRGPCASMTGAGRVRCDRSQMHFARARQEAGHAWQVFRDDPVTQGCVQAMEMRWLRVRFLRLISRGALRFSVLGYVPACVAGAGRRGWENRQW